MPPMNRSGSTEATLPKHELDGEDPGPAIHWRSLLEIVCAGTMMQANPIPATRVTAIIAVTRLPVRARVAPPPG